MSDQPLSSNTRESATSVIVVKHAVSSHARARPSSTSSSPAPPQCSSRRQRSSSSSSSWCCCASTSRLCVSIPPLREWPVLAAVLLIGMGAWMSVNALYSHSPVFVATQPEKQSITSYFVAFQQAGSLLFLLFHRLTLHLLPPGQSPRFLAVILAAATVALLLPSASASTTADIAGGPKSIILHVAMLVAGFSSAATNVYCYPAVSAYPRRYTAAYTLGLSLSATAVGVAALIQDGPEELNISPTAYFVFFTVLTAASVVAAVYLHCAEAPRAVRASLLLSPAPPTDDDAGADANGAATADESPPHSTPLPVATNATAAAVAAASESEGGANESDVGNSLFRPQQREGGREDAEEGTALIVFSGNNHNTSETSTPTTTEGGDGDRNKSSNPLKPPSPSPHLARSLSSPAPPQFHVRTHRVLLYSCVPLTAQFVLSGMSFGVIPSVLPYATLSYHNGPRVYLIATSVAFCLDPVARLLVAAPFTTQLLFARPAKTQFIAIGLLATFATILMALVVAIAAASPKPWGWEANATGALPIVLSVVASAVVAFTFTAAFYTFHDASGAAERAVDAVTPPPVTVTKGRDKKEHNEVPNNAATDDPSNNSANHQRRQEQNNSNNENKERTVFVKEAEGTVRGIAYRWGGLTMQFGATTGAILAFLLVVICPQIKDPEFR